MPNRDDAQTPPRAPLSTYRVQFNVNFGFADAASIVPYLHDLGASDLYASPYLQASSGSDHGYDISDHDRLNEDLGGESDHSLLASALRERGMGHLLDIVPNHMGIAESDNQWWMDVLENGQCSPFAPYFDIDWNPAQAELNGKVLLPILGDQFGRVLENGELRLIFRDGRFRIAYDGRELPISPPSSSIVLRAIAGTMSAVVGAEDADLIELESIVTALEHLPSRDQSDLGSVAERRRESLVSRRRLEALREKSAAFRSALDHALGTYNGSPGNPRSFDALEHVLDAQAYRLAYWRVAAEEINYRRFFDVNSLAGIRVERGEVFDATHRLILQLVREGKVTSLRIDHPDGLLDPRKYLNHLQNQASLHAAEGPLYIVVEKILTGEEQLSRDWRVAGTVGYEFLTRLNGLFVAGDNAETMTDIYHEFIRSTVDFARLVHEKKKLILRVALASELSVLALHLNRISEKNRRFRDFTLGSFTDALRETIACFPVYRTYIDAIAGRVGETDVENVERAIRNAIRRNRAMNPSIFEFIRDTLLLRWPEDLDSTSRDEHALFVLKFQQITGSVMAKGVEDTAFYIYHRLVSLNEVGGQPDRFGYSPGQLHEWIAGRAEAWPLAMNCGTTHDTKRGEDVRARINVLSEIPESWRARVRRWSEMNASIRPIVDDEPVPDANDEYLLYQTLVGTLPFDLCEEGALDDYRLRIQEYMSKATREAKVHTSWINPNEEFDAGLREFVGRLLDPRGMRPGGFLADVAEFTDEVAWYGMINSLAQTLVRLTAPGVPDIYQGREVWDLSLVDPDNRRPVDYACLGAMLGRIRERVGDEDRGRIAGDLVERWRDGAIKMYITHLALKARSELASVFRDGAYVPLAVEGDVANHVFAFAREGGGTCAVVAVPRLAATLERTAGASALAPRAWGTTAVHLPPSMARCRFRCEFTGREYGGEGLAAGHLFDGFPVALLKSEVGRGYSR